MVYNNTKNFTYKNIPISLYASNDCVLVEVYSNRRAVISKKVTDFDKLKTLLSEIKCTIDLGLNQAVYTDAGKIKTNFISNNINYV